MFGHSHDSHGFQLVRRQANLDESTTTTTTTLTTTTTRLVGTNTGAANTAGGGGNGGNGNGAGGTNSAAATTAVAQTQATRSPTTLPVSPTTTFPAFSTLSTVQPFVPATTNFATPANSFVTSFVSSAVQNSLATGGTGGLLTSQIQGRAGGFSTVTQTVPNTGAGGGAQTVVIVISYAPMPTSSSVSSMLNVSSTLNSTSSELPSSTSSFSLPSSPAESAAPANDAAGNKGLSKGAIAGIVVASVLGGLALLALLALLARYLLNRRRNRGNEDDALSMLGPAGPMSRESYAAQSGAGGSSTFFGGNDGPGPMMSQTR